VISSRHFDIAWLELRRIAQPTSIASKAQRKMLSAHRNGLVFDGTIATDSILGHLSFGGQWKIALQNAAKREPTAGRLIKVRIYRDIESLTPKILNLPETAWINPPKPTEETKTEVA
jgi:hypothetical protein